VHTAFGGEVLGKETWALIGNIKTDPKGIIW
jgi:hypothetical protein